PKMTLVSAPINGTINTRSFIPHTCHDAIGVLAAVTVGTACLLKDGPAAKLARLPQGNPMTLDIEHPTGSFGIVVTRQADGKTTSAVLRTARKLMDGMVFA
ncbi:MAG: PrpF domain-containing protein, partial [Deltaproteobacteria bacterium]